MEKQKFKIRCLPVAQLIDTLRLPEEVDRKHASFNHFIDFQPSFQFKSFIISFVRTLPVPRKTCCIKSIKAWPGKEKFELNISQSEFRVTWVEKPGPDTSSGQKTVSAAIEPIEWFHFKGRCVCRHITDEKY